MEPPGATRWNLREPLGGLGFVGRIQDSLSEDENPEEITLGLQRFISEAELLKRGGCRVGEIGRDFPDELVGCGQRNDRN